MQTLVRALHLIDALAESSHGLGVREISAELDLPKSAVGRILQALVDAGYAGQDAITKRYVLGPKAAVLGHAYASKVDLQRLAKPVMDKLCAATRETVSLNVRLQHMRICVAQVESPLELRAAGVIGQAYPLDTGAPGRVLLSAMRDDEIAEVLRRRKELCSYPPYRRLSKTELLKSVAEIRRTSIAIANQETMAGVCSIAVPIRNHRSEVVASLGLLLPHLRFSESTQRELIGHIRSAAGSIEIGLGFSGATGQVEHLSRLDRAVLEASATEIGRSTNA